MNEVITVLVTPEEIDVLAIALARSVYPESTATDAWAASADVWKHGSGMVCSLATMLAEARPQAELPDPSRRQRRYT